MLSFHAGFITLQCALCTTAMGTPAHAISAGRLTSYWLLVCRWAGEASAFSADVVPMVVQTVLKLVDRSRRDNLTSQLVPCIDYR